MPALVPDALLDAVAVSAEPAGVGEAIRARYAGDLVQRIYPVRADPGGRALHGAGRRDQIRVADQCGWRLALWRVSVTIARACAPMRTSNIGPV